MRRPPTRSGTALKAQGQGAANKGLEKRNHAARVSAMRPEEAAYIRDVLADFPAEAISPMLEIGSSTLAFRTIDKPHIDRDIHEPLKRRGVRIVTTDLLAEGVEIVGDVFDPQILRDRIDDLMESTAEQRQVIAQS